MARKRLNPEEINELLVQYRSERRRLSFQLERVREAIKDLRAARGDGDQGDEEGVVRRGPGRPRGSGTKRYRRKPGRRKKRTISGGGYKLSPWDEMVIEAIKKRDQLLPKSEILKAASVWAKKNEPKMTAQEVEAKITRVLQKLSGKRGVLGTHRSGLRRGYHYGLKEWFFSSSGLLRKQHYEKLVLSED